MCKILYIEDKNTTTKCINKSLKYRLCNILGKWKKSYMNLRLSSCWFIKHLTEVYTEVEIAHSDKHKSIFAVQPLCLYGDIKFPMQLWFFSQTLSQTDETQKILTKHFSYLLVSTFGAIVTAGQLICYFLLFHHIVYHDNHVAVHVIQPSVLTQRNRFFLTFLTYSQTQL